MMKRILVCSQFGALEENLKLARRYCLYVIRQGCSPFAPHLFYPQFLSDYSKEERGIGIKCGLEWLSCSDEVWVFVRNGVLSTGMRSEILIAIDLKIPVRYFDASIFSIASPCFDAIVPLLHIDGGRLPSEAELLSAKSFSDKCRKSLASVADALKKGARYEDLQEEVDRLLGDSEQPRDEVLEAKWEEDYRTSRS